MGDMRELISPDSHLINLRDVMGMHGIWSKKNTVRTFKKYVCSHLLSNECFNEKEMGYIYIYIHI